LLVLTTKFFTVNCEFFPLIVMSRPDKQDVTVNYVELKIYQSQFNL